MMTDTSFTDRLVYIAVKYLWLVSYVCAVVLEWNQHYGGEGQRFHQLQGLGEHCKFPQWVQGEATAAKSFGAFWVLRVSSPAVLLLDLGVIHSSFCGWARKLLRGRKDTFAPAVSALRERSPLLPPWFRRLCVCTDDVYVCWCCRKQC